MLLPLIVLLLRKQGLFPLLATTILRQVWAGVTGAQLGLGHLKLPKGPTLLPKQQ